MKRSAHPNNAAPYMLLIIMLCSFWLAWLVWLVWLDVGNILSLCLQGDKQALLGYVVLRCQLR